MILDNGLHDAPGFVTLLVHSKSALRAKAASMGKGMDKPGADKRPTATSRHGKVLNWMR